MLTEHFALAEFERSDIARRHGWDNRVPPLLLANVRRCAEMMERIRTLLWRERGFECAIRVTSGYRSLAVNRAVGSADGSAHNVALAVDWVSPAFGTPSEICRLLAQHVDALQIGQLINEFPGWDGEGWVHTGVDRPPNPINRVITIDRYPDGRVATLPGILDSFA